MKFFLAEHSCQVEEIIDVPKDKNVSHNNC